MIQAVYKYELPLSGRRVLDLPKGARVLSVQNQRERLCLWALVEPNAPRVGRVFAIAQTGQEFIAAEVAFVGTAHFAAGDYVVHVFEVLT